MIYNLLKGTKTYNSFITLAQKGRIPHAVLLYSKDNYTAQNLLKMFACTVICSSLQKPCLKCNDCGRVLRGVHPDCKTYPQKDKILVKDIDDLIQDTAYKPSEKSSKVYLLSAGDTMNIDSQNKLLKTLEEPYQSVYIFISAANPENMLSTVKSRCVEMEIPPFSAEQIYRFLSDGKEDATKKAAALSSGGLLGRAMEMSGDRDYLSFYNDIYSLFKELKEKDDILYYMDRINAFSDKDAALDIMQLYFRDCLMHRCHREDLIFDKNSEGIKDSEYFTQKDIIMFIEKAAKAKGKLRLNCNAAPIFENILIDIVDARQNYMGGTIIG